MIRNLAVLLCLVVASSARAGILWAGGEDVDFPNGSPVTVTQSTGTYRSGYARASFTSPGPMSKSTRVGVLHVPVAAGTACAQGNVCEGEGGTCDYAGTCQLGTPPILDDGNACTMDSCDPVLGAIHTPFPAGTSCADHDNDLVRVRAITPGGIVWTIAGDGRRQNSAAEGTRRSGSRTTSYVWPRPSALVTTTA